MITFMDLCFEDYGHGKRQIVTVKQMLKVAMVMTTIVITATLFNAHFSNSPDIYLLIKFIFLYVVRICGIRNNVEHLCNSNLLLYSMYICTSRNLLQCCTSNSNVVQS